MAKEKTKQQANVVQQIEWKCNTYLRLKARQVLVMVCRRNRGCSQERTGQMTQFGPAAERCKWHLSTVPARERGCQEIEGKTKRRGRLQSVTLRPKAPEENLFLLFPPTVVFWFQVWKQTGGRSDSRLLRPIQWAGLELSRIRWRSPPGFKTSQGGRGLTGYKGARRHHLCHLLVDGDSEDAAANQQCWERAAELFSALSDNSDVIGVPCHVEVVYVVITNFLFQNCLFTLSSALCLQMTHWHSISHLPAALHSDCTAGVTDAFGVVTHLQTHGGKEKNNLEVVPVLLLLSLSLSRSLSSCSANVGS